MQMNLPERIDRASYSETESFNMCERRHYYSYGEKIQGKGITEPLARGAIGHQILAIYYEARKRGVDHKQAVVEASSHLWGLVNELDLFDPIKFGTDLSVLLSDYFEVYADDDIEILEVEVAYDVQLTDDFTIPVVLDLIARIPGRGVFVIDHKFTYDFYDVDKLDLSPQLPLYMAALFGLNIHVDGIMYNELRTRETKVNKQLVEQKFRRTPLIITPNKITIIMREQMMAARRIGQLKSMSLDEWEKSVLRNHMACRLCPFTTVCVADLEDRDSQLVRDSFYEPRIRR